jgi:hypothetical protein
MRLSAWTSHAPYRESMSPKVLAVVEPVLSALGTEADPHCWIFWGDDPMVRWLVFAPTPAGLCSVSVRVNVPGEGPRAAGRLYRWTRVQVGELAVETAAGGRMVLSSQIEGQVLRAVDDDVRQAAAFVAVVLAAIDGRPLPDLDTVVPSRRRRVASSGKARPGTGARSGTGPRAGTGARPATKAVKAARPPKRG